MYDDRGLPLSPRERAAYDGAVALTQIALGDDEFATAWDAGRALPLEHAIAEAWQAEPGVGRAGGGVLHRS
jgi:hypothetical protein